MSTYNDKRILWMLGATLLLGWLGCGDGHPKRYQTTGTVTWQGKPVDGATVTFYPSGARPAKGTTDAQGKFSLFTFDPGDGAVEGEHTVTISKADLIKDPQTGYPVAKHLLPERYANMGETPLKAKVDPKGKNDFPFDL